LFLEIPPAAIFLLYRALFFLFNRGPFLVHLVDSKDRDQSITFRFGFSANSLKDCSKSLRDFPGNWQ
jgi:hypothetical protein